MWWYREFFWILALRDVRVRHIATALGVAWAIIQPFGTTVALIVELGDLSTNNTAKPLSHFCGLQPWQHGYNTDGLGDVFVDLKWKNEKGVI